MGHYATPQKDSGLLFNPINWGIVGSSVAGPHSATPQYRKLLVFLLVLDVEGDGVCVENISHFVGQVGTVTSNMPITHHSFRGLSGAFAMYSPRRISM